MLVSRQGTHCNYLTDTRDISWSTYAYDVSMGNLKRKCMLAFGERAILIILEFANDPFEYVATSFVVPYRTLVSIATPQ